MSNISTINLKAYLLKYALSILVMLVSINTKSQNMNLAPESSKKECMLRKGIQASFVEKNEKSDFTDNKQLDSSGLKKIATFRKPIVLPSETSSYKTVVIKQGIIKSKSDPLLNPTKKLKINLKGGGYEDK